MSNYIKWIRSKTGRDKIFLNFAGACVVDDEGRVLLQKRAGQKEAWGFPGGAMELGESAEETALRETQEETGLIVKAEHLLGVYTKYHDEYPSGDSAQPINIVFICSIVGGELNSQNPETEELCFFHKHEIPKLFNKQHNDILQDFLGGAVNVWR